MSFSYDLENVDETIESLINKKCLLKPNKSQYNTDPEAIPFYEVDEDNNVIYLPLGQSLEFYDQYPNDFIKFPKTNGKFLKKLLTSDTDPTGKGRDQDVIAKEVMQHLKENRTCFLALPTGWGKTLLGIYFCCVLKLKGLVISHITEVIKQWIEEFEKSSTLKAQHIEGKVQFDKKADVYVCGVKKLSKIPRSKLKNIGFVIFDEAHVATVSALCSLLKLNPKYMMFMSATPKRVDGMDRALRMFMGNKNAVIREECKDFVVYKYSTDYKPTIEYTIVKGRTVPNWTSIINSISCIEERWDEVVKIVIEHPDHRILILSDRQNQSVGIYNKLIELEEDVELLIGTTKKHRDARVLVAGMRKAGVGFNDPTLTMLIMVSDTKNVIQYEGRIRTTNNIIYDFVDDFSTFEKHWDLREKWYIKRGAEIKYEGVTREIEKNNGGKVISERMTRRME